jgi:multidrug resistance efflux pump
LSEGWLRQSGCPAFPIDVIELPARSEGYLVELNAMLGSEVAAGQVLGKLDARLAEMERNVANLQQQVAASEAQDQHDIKLAEEIAEEARLALEGYRNIRERGSVSDAEVRQKQLLVSQADLRILGAKQAAEQRKLKARIAQAQAMAAEERLRNLSIVAPVAGTVTEVFRKPGQWVQPGQPVLKIVRMDQLRVDFYVRVEEIDPSRLKGASVQATSSRAGQAHVQLAGQVTNFDPEVSSLGVVRMHATLENLRLQRDWQGIPGMEFDVQVRLP